MHDDVSSIPNTGCNVLSNDSVVYNYHNNVRKTYIKVGSTWYYTSTSNFNSFPAGYQCVDVSTFNSRAEFYPIYIFLAFILAIFVWFFVWRLIKPLIRWRI